MTWTATKAFLSKWWYDLIHILIAPFWLMHWIRTEEDSGDDIIIFESSQMPSWKIASDSSTEQQNQNSWIICTTKVTSKVSPGPPEYKLVETNLVSTDDINICIRRSRESGIGPTWKSQNTQQVLNGKLTETIGEWQMTLGGFCPVKSCVSSRGLQ